MRLSVLIVGLTGAIGASAALSQSAQPVDGYVPRTFRSSTGTRMPYRLFIPSAEARVRPLPLIVYLHGSGGAGTDNLRQVSLGNTRGTRLWVSADTQKQHPVFVLAPQLPEKAPWHSMGAALSPQAAAVIELIASVSQEFSVDADRVYLMGQSLGGYGTWDLIGKQPDLFAAAVPLCGGGDPTRVAAARDVAVWAFHGAKDQTVPVERSREMVAALRAAGGAVKYTEYPDVAHDVWTRAFAERELADWLFSQRRIRR